MFRRNQTLIENSKISLCENSEFEKKDIIDMVFKTGSRPLDYIEHKFNPQGKSAVCLLEESHISVHTYPEHSYISIDIYEISDDIWQAKECY